MFRLLLLFAGWTLLSGLSSPYCAQTDTPFGGPVEALSPDRWNGYWCVENSIPCFCLYLRVSEEEPGEVWIEFPGEVEKHGFEVIEVRRVPDQDMDWFVFPKYACRKSNGEGRCGYTSSTEEWLWDGNGYMVWALLTHLQEEKAALFWPDVDPGKLEEAVLEGELPGVLIAPYEPDEGDPDYALIGSLLTDAHMKKLVEDQFFPIFGVFVFARPEVLPDCSEYVD